MEIKLGKHFHTLFSCVNSFAKIHYRKMNPSESQQDLLSNEARSVSVHSLQTSIDYILGPVEKHFLLSAERGDCATVKR